MYYVREYTPTCRFLKIINSTLTLIIFKNLQLECILHYLMHILDDNKKMLWLGRYSKFLRKAIFISVNYVNVIFLILLKINTCKKKKGGADLCTILSISYDYIFRRHFYVTVHRTCFLINYHINY